MLTVAELSTGLSRNPLLFVYFVPFVVRLGCDGAAFLNQTQVRRTKGLKRFMSMPFALSMSDAMPRVHGEKERAGLPILWGPEGPAKGARPTLWSTRPSPRILPHPIYWAA